MPLRPVNIHEQFHSMTDAFCSCFLGLGALHNAEYINHLRGYKWIPMESSVGEDANIDIAYYLSRFDREDINKGKTPFTTSVLKVVCQSFCISAYESLKLLEVYNSVARNHVVQFLRHIRNASAHGNTFTFQSGQPDKPANWHGKQVTESLSGSICFFDYLSPGDLPLLLEDVSKLV